MQTHLYLSIELKEVSFEENPEFKMCLTPLSSKNFICPTITAYRFNNFPSDPRDITAHVMVATGLTRRIIERKTEYFVQCKNSYRNDFSNPGKDWQILNQISGL